MKASAGTESVPHYALEAVMSLAAKEVSKIEKHTNNQDIEK